MQYNKRHRRRHRSRRRHSSRRRGNGGANAGGAAGAAADGTTSALAAGPSNGEAAGLVVTVDGPSENYDEGSAWSPERSSFSMSRRYGIRMVGRSGSSKHRTSIVNNPSKMYSHSEVQIYISKRLIC